MIIKSPVSKSFGKRFFRNPKMLSPCLTVLCDAGMLWGMSFVFCCITGLSGCLVASGTRFRWKEPSACGMYRLYKRSPA